MFQTCQSRNNLKLISHINKLFSHFYEIFSQKISKCINNHDASHCWRPNMWQMCPSHVKIKIFRCRCRLGTEGESDGNHILKWAPLSNYHFTMIRKTDTRLNISTPVYSPQLRDYSQIFQCEMCQHFNDFVYLGLETIFPHSSGSHISVSCG